jgi:tight adherence protein C
MNPIDSLTRFFESGNLAVVLAVITMLAALGSVWFGLVARDPAAARLRNWAKFRDGMRTGTARGSRNKVRADFRQTSLSMMRGSVAKWNLVRGRQVEQISRRLARAGWRSKDALTTYIFAKAALPMVLMGGVLLFLTLRSKVQVSGFWSMLVVIICLAFGFWGTDMLVNNAGAKRVQKLTKSLPDALDLLVICAEAGLSLESAFRRVAEEMNAGSPEMADEMTLTVAELNFLPDRTMAIRNLAIRTDMPALRSMANTLIQSEKFGTPLANSLRVLSAEFREDRMTRAEEKAARLPTLMTIPMILLILPALFMVVLGPAIMRIVDALSK